MKKRVIVICIIVLAAVLISNTCIYLHTVNKGASTSNGSSFEKNGVKMGDDMEGNNIFISESNSWKNCPFIVGAKLEMLEIPSMKESVIDYDIKTNIIYSDITVNGSDIYYSKGSDDGGVLGIYKNSVIGAFKEKKILNDAKQYCIYNEDIIYTKNEYNDTPKNEYETVFRKNVKTGKEISLSEEPIDELVIGKDKIYCFNGKKSEVVAVSLESNKIIARTKIDVLKKAKDAEIIDMIPIGENQVITVFNNGQVIESDMKSGSNQIVTIIDHISENVNAHILKSYNGVILCGNSNGAIYTIKGNKQKKIIDLKADADVKKHLEKMTDLCIGYSYGDDYIVVTVEGYMGPDWSSELYIYDYEGNAVKKAENNNIII